MQIFNVEKRAALHYTKNEQASKVKKEESVMAAEAWKEEVRYINDTPIRIVIDDQISYKRGLLMPHWHEEVEIDCVLEGALYYTVGGVVYHLHQGDAIVVDSGIIHSGRCNEGTTLEETHATVMTLQINKNVFRYGSYTAPTFKVFLPREENAEIRSVLMEVKSVYQQQNPYYEVLLNSNVLRLCYFLLKNHTVQEKGMREPVSTNNEIKKALTYIETHCKEKLKLEEIAEKLNYNPSYFSRRFHEFTGFTFVEYLNRCRTDVAALMLMESDKTVSEIALDCGFSNISSFITYFKRQYKMTPEAYRKMNQGLR